MFERRQATRRRFQIDDLPTWEELRSQAEGDLAAVELLRQQLEEVDTVVRTVVEMKVLEGCTAEQIAHRLGCSKVSVYHNWQFGRHWLQTKLKGAVGTNRTAAG